MSQTTIPTQTAQVPAQTSASADQVPAQTSASADQIPAQQVQLQVPSLTPLPSLTPAANTSAVPGLTTINGISLKAAQLQAVEAEVRLKYPHLDIKPGSMVQDDNHRYFHNKRRVMVQCPHCPTVVERATSDLHTFEGCPVCMKTVRKYKKAAKKAGHIIQTTRGFNLQAMAAQLAAQAQAQTATGQPAQPPVNLNNLAAGFNLQTKEVDSEIDMLASQTQTPAPTPEPTPEQQAAESQPLSEDELMAQLEAEQLASNS